MFSFLSLLLLRGGGRRRKMNRGGGGGSAAAEGAAACVYYYILLHFIMWVQQASCNQDSCVCYQTSYNAKVDVYLNGTSIELRLDQ